MYVSASTYRYRSFSNISPVSCKHECEFLGSYYCHLLDTDHSQDYTGQAKALVPGTLYLEFPDIVLAYSERCTLLLARRWSFPPRSMCYVCTVQYEAKRLHEGFEKPSLGTRCSPSPMTAAFANRQAYSIHTKMTAAKTTHRLLFYKYLISFCDLSMLQSIVLSLPP